jgi:hypothetical protein
MTDGKLILVDVVDWEEPLRMTGGRLTLVDVVVADFAVVPGGRPKLQALLFAAVPFILSIKVWGLCGGSGGS